MGAQIASKLNKGASSVNSTVGSSGGPVVTMSTPASIEMHLIGDWEIDQFVAASRGRLADAMFLFWGGCLGSFITTAKYVWDYFKSHNHYITHAALAQTLLFAACLALAGAFSVINRKSTKKATDLADSIRKRGKVVFKSS